MLSLTWTTAKQVKQNRMSSINTDDDKEIKMNDDRVFVIMIIFVRIRNIMVLFYQFFKIQYIFFKW